LGVVRRFAEYVSTLDPRTEIPAKKLLPFQYRRPNPHLYQDDDVLRLIKATKHIDNSNAAKCTTCATLFGLLAVTGMRVGTCR
jgi:integrase